MGRPAGWMEKLTGRGVMRSQGTPSLRREVERQFPLCQTSCRLLFLKADDPLER